MKQKNVVLKGDFRDEVKVFNASVVEVTIRADIFCDGTRFADIPLLRLFIEEFDDETRPVVEDDYFRYCYLKPVRAFRNHLIEYLRLLMSIRQEPLIKRGLAAYITELREFSEVRSLISQAKGHVSSIREQDSQAEKKAKNVLIALDVQPLTDIEFSVS